MKWKPNLKIKLMNDDNFNDAPEQHWWMVSWVLTHPIYAVILIFTKMWMAFSGYPHWRCNSQMVHILINYAHSRFLCTSPLFMKMCLIHYVHPWFLWRCGLLFKHILYFYVDAPRFLCTGWGYLDIISCYLTIINFMYSTGQHSNQKCMIILIVNSYGKFVSKLSFRWDFVRFPHILLEKLSKFFSNDTTMPVNKWRWIVRERRCAWKTRKRWQGFRSRAKYLAARKFH